MPLLLMESDDVTNCLQKLLHVARPIGIFFAKLLQLLLQTRNEFARDARVYAVVDHGAADIKSCRPRPGLCVWRRLTSKHKGEHALQGFDKCCSRIHKHCLCVMTHPR